MYSTNSIECLIYNVRQDYINARVLECNRRDAINRVFAKYKEELSDYDDKLAIVFGVTYALCANKELFQDFSNWARKVINGYQDSPILNKLIYHVEKSLKLLDDESVYGEEYGFCSKRHYDPIWNIGDTFIHKIENPKSENQKLSNQYILLSVAYKYLDDDNNNHYLMYAAIIPNMEAIEDSTNRHAIRFVRTMRHDNGWDYFFHVCIRDLEHEYSLKLSYVGNFTDLPFPKDHVPENPLVATPLFGPRKESSYPGYEMQICMLYKRYGVIE